ncbi:MAG: 6-phosphofructokinase, partial [Nonlabens sp.]
MDIKINKIGVMTSGGDSPGMNAAIRAVVRTCAFHEIECVGIYRGYQGLIEGDFKQMNARSVNNIINKGGTILKSARSKEFMTKEGRVTAYAKAKEEGLDALVVIGGDGSFTGAMVFSQEFGFPVMGIPGTIAIDIYGTSSTLGYDTA